MKIWVTGEAGCVARNLVDYCNVNTAHEVVNRLSEEYFDYWRMAITSPVKEINIFDPSLPRLIRDSGAEVIVHTASIDYDQTKKNPHLAIHTHIDGAYTIAEVAKKLNLPLLFLKASYCNDLYYTTQYCGSQLVSQVAPQHACIDVPYLYGKYDTKSFIAKMILSAKGQHAILPKDTSSYRDYIHTSELIQIIDFFLSKNMFDFSDRYYADISTTSESLEKIYTGISESHNFMMDCSFEYEDSVPSHTGNNMPDNGIGILQNRIIMKDAIENMIKDFEL